MESVKKNKKLFYLYSDDYTTGRKIASTIGNCMILVTLIPFGVIAIAVILPTIFIIRKSRDYMYPPDVYPWTSTSNIDYFFDIYG